MSEEKNNAGDNTNEEKSGDECCAGCGENNNNSGSCCASVAENDDVPQDEASAIEIMEGKYKRALADYQNLLKRTAAEKQEYVKYANEQLLHEILPVYDNLKLAVAHSNSDENGNGAVIEGVKYVLGQFKSALDGMGVKEIITVGEKYDHHSMEAMEEKETDDESKDGLVESEIMPGYKLADRVIRAARVAVYKLKNN